MVFDYDKLDGFNRFSDDTLVTSYSKSSLTSIQGKNVNLSAAPYVSNSFDNKLRRRIFESSPITFFEPQIFATQEKFYKRFADEENGIYHLFGMKDSSQSAMFSHILLKNNNNSIIEPQLFTNGKDSLWSEWFKINDINQIFFYTQGNYQTMKLKIERKRD